MSKGSYIYEPLSEGQIRVLVLQPGTGDDPLQGELVFHQLLGDDGDKNDSKSRRSGPSGPVVEAVDAEDIAAEDAEVDVPASIEGSEGQDAGTNDRAPDISLKSDVGEGFIDLKGDPESGDDVHALSCVDCTDGYCAISYAWCEAALTHRILLGTRYRAITTSLFQALRRFRNASRPVHLWADALCINQDDQGEVNSQVAMMGDVFSNAKEVLVWLGEETSTTCTAFLLLNQLKHYGRRLYYILFAKSYWQLARPVFLELSQFLQNNNLARLGSSPCQFCESNRGGSTDVKLCVEALIDLFEGTYFSRLWPFQEMALAKDSRFFCGRHVIMGDDMRMAAKAIQSRRDRLNFTQEFDDLLRNHTGLLEMLGPLRHCLGTAYRRLEKAGKQHLIASLCDTARLNCTKPHDRIYAVRRIAGVEPFQHLVPDYGVDLGELWQQVSLVLLHLPSPRNTRQKRYACPSIVLALRGTQPHSYELADQASWIVDYNNLSQASLQKIRYYQLQTANFHAGRSSFKRPSGLISDLDPSDSDILLVRGRSLGLVSRSLPGSQPYHCIDHDEDHIAWYLQCSQFCFDDPNEAPERSESAMQELLSQGATRDARFSRDMLTGATKALSAQRLEKKAAHNVNQLSRYLSDFWGACRRFDNNYWLDTTRVLAYISSGYYGWVPERAEVGDHVCVLEGADQAFVLRDCGVGQYRVVGDAYVQGAMYGEMWSRDDLELRTFRIR